MLRPVQGFQDPGVDVVESVEKSGYSVCEEEEQCSCAEYSELGSGESL